MKRLLDKYNNFHIESLRALPVEVHILGGFTFPTIAGLFGMKALLIVFGLMMVVITIKEYLDDETVKGPYSLIDWGSWLIGGGLAVGVELIRGLIHGIV